MFSPKDITDILLDHSDEGYSVNAENEVPKSGYMVGGYVPSLVLAGPYEYRVYHTTDAWLTRNWHFFSEGLGEYFAGVWTDQETGKIYIDISRNIESLDEAIAVGLNFNEIAIWDVENNREIRLQDN